MRRLRRAGDPVVCDLRRELTRRRGRAAPRHPAYRPGRSGVRLGRYAGPAGSAIVAMKEHGRTDLIAPLAHALALGIHRLLSWGMLDVPLTIVPAPTRRSAARRRGGDPVDPDGRDRGGRASRHHRRPGAADEGPGPGLGRPEQRGARTQYRRSGADAAVAGAAGADVLLVDDIVTTGATASESVRVLQAAGARVTACAGARCAREHGEGPRSV